MLRRVQVCWHGPVQPRLKKERSSRAFYVAGWVGTSVRPGPSGLLPYGDALWNGAAGGKEARSHGRSPCLRQGAGRSGRRRASGFRWWPIPVLSTASIVTKLARRLL